jgi:glutaminyl-tRNA synthetase
MSKRKLLQLVRDGHVDGWDDPRMPTLSGMRRRGYTPRAIGDFCERIGVAKRDSTVDIALLEHCLREDLNQHAPRVMAVINPLRVVIENYPEGQTEQLEAINNPEDESMGTRQVPFSRVIYIERDDFLEDPPRKFFRLAPGREVRLRYAYFIKCTEVVKDERNGEIKELRCTYDPQTRGGNAPDGRKVKATLHWVSADHAVPAEIRMYDNLFSVEDPAATEAGKDWTDNINPDSLIVHDHAYLEPSLSGVKEGQIFQFERLGYYCVDPLTADGDKPVINRTVSLRDTWARIQRAQNK